MQAPHTILKPTWQARAWRTHGAVFELPAWLPKIHAWPTINGHYTHGAVFELHGCQKYITYHQWSSTKLLSFHLCRWGLYPHQVCPEQVLFPHGWNDHISLDLLGFSYPALHTKWNKIQRIVIVTLASFKKNKIDTIRIYIFELYISMMKKALSYLVFTNEIGEFIGSYIRKPEFVQVLLI